MLTPSDDFTYRAVDIKWDWARSGVRWHRHWATILWGSDIFIQGVPVLKVLVLVNVLVWALMWWGLR